ncbi:MAG TPA: tyrosine--tRNA ligase, partial [Kofleriaceae bacterium]|nr:tyrosine--tRNA ligase [Kofleriaceae bacterium]
LTMHILDELQARGQIADATDREGLRTLLATPGVPFYCGFDPTGTSLHIGNLVPITLMARLQRAGHRPVVVVGGATGMIGDPSGKSDERNLLDDATLQTNLAGIRAQLSKLLDFESPTNGALMTNNADWTKGVSYLEFLRDVGKYLTINWMMGKDSVKSRLEGTNGISYTEFSYMLLQAFDFVELAKPPTNCRLQVGGNDQYGNITAGTELQHKLGRQRIFGLTAPLLLDSSGQKMGKTSTGERIWLDAERTPPFEFYKYWLNVTDADAPRLLRMFSLKPLAEINELLATHEQDLAKRVAQRELARAMTSWVHGEAAITSIESANKVFAPGKLDELTGEQLATMSQTIPTIEIQRTELDVGIPIIDLLARTVASSKSEARRLIQDGGANVNNVRITQIDHKVTREHLIAETWLLVRKGKKELRLVRVV